MIQAILSDMLDMGVIVYIDDYPHIQYVGKNSLDHGLEGGGSINYTEVYNRKLEKAVAIAKGCLLLVTFLNTVEVEAAFEVDLSKELGASKPILKLRYQR